MQHQRSKLTEESWQCVENACIPKWICTSIYLKKLVTGDSPIFLNQHIWTLYLLLYWQIYSFTIFSLLDMQLQELESILPCISSVELLTKFKVQNFYYCRGCGSQKMNTAWVLDPRYSLQGWLLEKASFLLVNWENLTWSLLMDNKM